MSAIREVGEKAVLEGIASVYIIGFINSDMKDDETEYDAEGMDELEELWKQFCEENQFDPELVIYVYRNGVGE